MRRRIYVDPEGPLQDRTADAYAYDYIFDEEPWDVPSWCRLGSFYDDALWAEYQEALRVVGELESRILRQLRYEPMDEVERRIAARVKEIEAVEDRGIVFAEHDRLSVEAVENAVRAGRERGLDELVRLTEEYGGYPEFTDEGGKK